MKRRERGALGIAGIASWIAGSVATFTGGEGSGAVAMIGAGAVASVLALIGHWPSRVAFSGNELMWEDVVESVDEQIEAAEDAGDDSVIRELKELRKRLAEAERTGSIPMHPAAQYDEAVHSALRRVLPGVTVLASSGRRRDQADFHVEVGTGRLLVETKYKSDPRSPFAGSTLDPLLSQLGGSDRLLIVTNTVHADRGRDSVKKALGDRARVITWFGPMDDDVLQAAIAQLLPRPNRPSA